MSSGRVVLITMPYDQVDILADFLDWHLDLGIDLILALDGGSTDGSRDVLEQYSKAKRVVWFALPERDMSKYSIADELATRARDRHQADWIIYCDADEFLSTRGKSLRAVLSDADADGVTLLSLPRRTMIGRLIPPGRRATEVLTLRIDRTLTPTAEQRTSWDFQVPFAFLTVADHVAVRAAAMGSFASGMHSAAVTWGAIGTSDLHILHFPIRGYEDFQQKVRNTEKWLADNSHLPPTWGWHWRRWIQLEKAGRLREDYERQFVTADRANALVEDGTCTIDTTIAEWVARRQTRPDVGSHQRAGWLQHLIRALRPARRSATP